MAWLSGYTTRKKLTIDQTKIDADLVDFPVLITLTGVRHDFSKGNADGFDTRFTSSDGTTLLKYERERHDSVNSLAEYWVKVPTVDGAVDTDIYFYYRTDDTADGADAANAWDANFKGVWHLADLTTSTVADSKGGNTGNKTAANTPLEVAGKIYKGQDFGTSSNQWDITHADLNITRLLPFTWEAWVYLDDVTASHPFLMTRPGNYTPSCVWIVTGWFGAGYVLRVGLANAWDSNVISVHGDQALSNGVWYHIMITYDGSGAASGVKTYVNGVADSMSTDYDVLTGEIDSNVNWGWGQSWDRWSDGLRDEIRFSDNERPVAYARATYNSGVDTLLTYGGEETPPAGVIENAIFFGTNF